MVLAGLHLVLRASIDISLVPERQPPYIRLTDGSIRNAFTLRLHDRRAETGALALRVEGRPGARLALATAPRPEEAGDLLLPADPRRLPLTERLTVTLPPGAAAPGRQTLRVLLIDPATGAVLSARETYFWAPETGGRP